MLLQGANEVVAQIPDANLDLACYQMCSQYVLNAAFDKLGDDAENLLLWSMTHLSCSLRAAGLVSQMFVLYLLRFFLPKGGPVMVTRFDQGEQTVLIIS